MVVFWLAAAMLVMAAIAFVVYPLFHPVRSAVSVVDRKRANVQAFRYRLYDAELELKLNGLSNEEFKLYKSELEQELLADIPLQEDVGASYIVERKQLILVVLLALLIPLVGLPLYKYWGAADEMGQWIAMENSKGMSLHQAVVELQQRLASNPDNPEGWFVLAGTLLDLGRYQEAADALTKTQSYIPDNAPIKVMVMGQKAQALFFAGGGKITQEVKQAIDDTLALAPNEPTVMGILGIAAYNQKLYKEAIGFWQRALSSNPDEKAAQALRSGIIQAQAQLQQSASLGDDSLDGKKRSLERISVTVTLSPEANAQLRDDQFVFVLVRRAGEKMPLAVRRVSAAALSETIVLDQSNSMVGQSLENNGPLQVVARISQSNNPIPEKGDWFGEIDGVTLAEKQQLSLKLQIDKQYQ
ncbi:c-type cytochrome biogenesis protein CcmI [Pokkaliibacter sp. MBI-7]|uniref:c-type cytochrome biogenesis protein CcmI n=1 Tax=Pokkaliibacter sp. MBI-7 TaxID=3040600 RepID=UPI00244A322E|nr:c-type cytochrome biogenesis protein CcmI [Pokkaliibacter sp. MBI-7]MDH2431229.1 c-type cytochrome biogenesis protein CcmI [Pokkaliibacter sp. MBI-7]